MKLKIPLDFSPYCISLPANKIIGNMKLNDIIICNTLDIGIE
jgi:hypothetical protein